MKKSKSSIKKNFLKIFIILVILIIFCIIGILILKSKNVNKVQTTFSLHSINRENLITKVSLKLELKSAYGDNEGYHPKVIAFDEAWNGYYYWIAFTPYPQADQAKENPHILASNDMINWVEPEGFENPLEAKPAGNSKYFYNSDTHLLYNEKENRLECYWRYVDDVNKIVIIYRKYTYDGSNWSDKEIFIENDRTQVDYLSPVIIIEDGKYKFWYIDRNLKLRYIERDIDSDEWSEARTIEIEYEEELYNWHFDIIKTDKGYEMVMSAFVKNHNTMNLYYSYSVDNEHYTKAETILSPLKSSWNDKGIYRSSILYYQNMYYIYYSGIGNDNQRGVGIAYGKDIKQLVWLTENNLYDFEKLVSKTTCYE